MSICFWAQNSVFMGAILSFPFKQVFVFHIEHTASTVICWMLHFPLQELVIYLVTCKFV